MLIEHNQEGNNNMITLEPTINIVDNILNFPLIKHYSTLENIPLHTNIYYEMFYVKKGSGTHTINGNSQLFESGSFIFVRPNDTHEFKSLNYLDLEILSIEFSQDELLYTLDFLNVPISKVTMPTLPVHYSLHGHSKTFIEHQLEFMHTKENPEERLQLFHVFLPVALYLLQTLDIKAYKKDLFPKWLEDLDTEMSKRENYILGLPKMLELSMYSQEHLNRVFKRYFKTTPTEYINTKRLGYASQLLLEQKYSTADICHMAGFNNLSHFYSVFKKQYKCTPNQFQKTGIIFIIKFYLISKIAVTLNNSVTAIFRRFFRIPISSSLMLFFQYEKYSF